MDIQPQSNSTSQHSHLHQISFYIQQASTTQLSYTIPVAIMADQSNQSSPAQLQVSLSFNTFTLFSNLPTEIRSKIWQAAFEKRQVVIRHRRNHPPLDLLTTGRFLLVNHEALYEFQLRYQKCFDQLGQKAVLINPKVDALRFDASIHASMHDLKEYTRAYPDLLSSLRYLEVHPRGATQWDQMNLNYLTSLKTITVSAYHTEPIPHDTPDDSISTALTLQALKTFVKASSRTIELHGVFHRRTTRYRYSIYFQSDGDLSHVSYGRIVGLAFPKCQPLQLEWCKIDKPWTAFSPPEDAEDDEDDENDEDDDEDDEEEILRLCRSHFRRNLPRTKRDHSETARSRLVSSY